MKLPDIKPKKAISKPQTERPDLREQILDAAESLFTVTAGRPRRLRHQIKDAMRGRKVPLRTVLRDGVTGVRAL